jgi:hypothetical protein
MRKKRKKTATTRAKDRARGRIWARTWRAAHPEEARAGWAKWAAENPEKAKAANARWRATHPERVKELRRKYYAAEREKARARNAAHPEEAKAKHRKDWLATYGLTVAQYDAMLAEQGGVCAVCGNATKGRLHVDHVHGSAPTLVRGLLCRQCNTAIGFLEDSEERLARAIEYLKRSRTPRLIKQEG